MKNLINIISFSLGDTAKNISKVLISSFGILFLISFLVIYITLRDSVKDYIETKLFGKLSINELMIYPQIKKKNKLFTHAINLHASIAPVNEKKISSMTELTEVFPIIKLDYEVKVRGAMMGQARRMHMPVCGVDRRFFKGKDPAWYRFKNSSPVPIAAPKAFIDLLNNWFSVIDVPLMDASKLNGLPLQLIITTLPGDDEGKKEFTVEAKIHSFTDIFAFIGVIAPADFIKQFAAKHRRDTGRPKRGYTCVMMYAKVKDVKKIPSVTKSIERLGLTVESQDDIAKRTNEALEVFDQFSIFIITIFFIITVISIFNSFLTIVYNRSQKFSLKRVLGVSKLRILLNFVIEAAVVGLILGIIGYAAGNYFISSLLQNISKWVPSLSGIAVTTWRYDLLILSLSFSVLISSLSALVPAFFAANINLFRAVRK